MEWPIQTGDRWLAQARRFIRDRGSLGIRPEQLWDVQAPVIRLVSGDRNVRFGRGERVAILRANLRPII